MKKVVLVINLFILGTFLTSCGSEGTMANYVMTCEDTCGQVYLKSENKCNVTHGLGSDEGMDCALGAAQEAENCKSRC